MICGKWLKFIITLGLADQYLLDLLVEVNLHQHMHAFHYCMACYVLSNEGTCNPGVGDVKRANFGKLNVSCWGNSLF